jgi:anti-sigma factor RsiW
MLSDPLRQLLSAYVDGELSNRQRKAVQRLLRRSAEARTLLRGMQEDAARLRALPRQHLDDEFAARVVRAVRQGGAPAPRRVAA